MRRLLCLSIVAVLTTASSTSQARKRCDPCAKANGVRGSGWGLVAIPPARLAILRKIVLTSFRQRARRKRGYRLARRSCAVWKGRKSCQAQVWAKGMGRASLSSGPVDLLEARYLLEGNIPPHEPEPGRDELWVFPASADKPQTIIKLGSPGPSGSNGNALAFACQPDLCALVWETGVGQLSNQHMRILRIAGSKVRRVAKLPERIAKGIGFDIGAEVLPARCDQQACVCLETIGAEKRRRYRLALTPQGFRTCR